MTSKNAVKIALILIALAVLLSACTSDYSLLNMPSDEACTAAGYNVTQPLAGMTAKANCVADALDDGSLNHSSGQ